MSSFTFICDAGGVINQTKFEADTWSDALENFKFFLRGAGFYFDDDEVSLGETVFDKLDKLYNREESKPKSSMPEDEGTNTRCCDPKFDTKALRDLKWEWDKTMKKWENQPD